MAQPYSQTREVHLKLVFFGPAAAGKTSAINYLYRALRPDLRGQLVAVNTGADRTLFFDFYPTPPPRLLGVSLHMQIYTASGGIQNEATRRALLAGADGVLFIADSQRGREQDNIRALEQLRTCLIDLGQRVDQLPLVLAWNKRDLSNTLPVGELEAGLNMTQAPSFATVAEVGQGVFEAFRAVASRALESALKRRPDALSGAAQHKDVTQPGDMVTNRRMLATQDAQRALLSLANRYPAESVPTSSPDNSALLRAAAMDALTATTPSPTAPAPSSQSAPVPASPSAGSSPPSPASPAGQSPRPVSGRPMHVMPVRDSVSYDEPSQSAPSSRAATSSRRVLLPSSEPSGQGSIPKTGFGAPSSGSGGGAAASPENARPKASSPGGAPSSTAPSRSSKLSTGGAADAPMAQSGREIFLSQLLPPGSLRAQLQDIERQLYAGQYSPAVRRAASLFYALTAAEATREPDEGPAWRGLVLGLPVERYLRFRQAVHDAEAGKCTPEDGVFALFFLLDAVLRKEAHLARSS